MPRQHPLTRESVIAVGQVERAVHAADVESRGRQPWCSVVRVTGRYPSWVAGTDVLLAASQA